MQMMTSSKLEIRGSNMLEVIQRFLSSSAKLASGKSLLEYGPSSIALPAAH
jgi:hypothetical protein